MMIVCSYCGVNLTFSNELSTQENKQNNEEITITSEKDLEERDSYMITKIEKIDEKEDLPEKDNTVLVGLGIAAVGGLAVYLSTLLHPREDDIQWLFKIPLYFIDVDAILENRNNG